MNNAKKNQAQAPVREQYIRGINKVGHNTHWPKSGFIVRDGKVYRLSNDEFMGVEDASVSIVPSEVLEALEGAAANKPSDNAGETPANEDTSNDKPLQPEVTTGDMNKPDSTTTTDSTTETTTTEEATMNTSNTNNTETTTTTTEEETVVKASKPLNRFGVAWRVTLVLAVFALAIAAIAFGTSFAVAWLATLGLSGIVTSAATLLVYFIGFLSTLGLMNTTTGCLNTISSRYATTKFESELRAACAAAA